MKEKIYKISYKIFKNIWMILIIIMILKNKFKNWIIKFYNWNNSLNQKIILPLMIVENVMIVDYVISVIIV